MNLFVYGTLMVPKIWNAVTGYHDPATIPGTLAGHRIQRVTGGDFPAIVLDLSSTKPVSGLIIKNVSPAALERLDQYEDDFYERISVSIQTEAGNSVNAQVYRMPNQLAEDILSDEPWSLEWFESEALERYWNRLFA